MASTCMHLLAYLQELKLKKCFLQERILLATWTYTTVEYFYLQSLLIFIDRFISLSKWDTYYRS